jgi:D-alanine-D-alanine ligase
MRNEISIEGLENKRIGVLMGGWSREREISLLSGDMVCDALRKKHLNAVPVDVKKDTLHSLPGEGIDVAFIALHGEGGEDGQIQAVLQVMGIPYTGSGVLASALSLNKAYSKMIFQMNSVRTPDYCLLGRHDDIGASRERILVELGLPVVLKPISEGSSIGVRFVRSEETLGQAIETLQKQFGNLIAEKLVQGMCATVGILGCGKEARALPVLELVPQREFYDYTAKYTEGMTEFIIPARLETDVYAEAQELALRAHHALGCHGFSRADMVVKDDRVPYVLEVNSIPGLMQLSDLPAEAKHEGIEYEDLVVEILRSAFLERPD